MSIARLEDVANIGRALTDAEKAYLHSRSRDHDIADNDRQFGNKTHVAGLPLFADVADEVFQLKVDDDKDKAADIEAEHDDSGDHDFSQFDAPLVSEVQALDYSALKAELKERNIAAVGKKKDLQLLLLKAVSEQEKK